MEYSTEQEFKQVWRVLRCKANCGGTGSVIEITKTGFLNLVDNSLLKYPATYKITDIEEGLFIETLSKNTFKSESTLLAYVPNYYSNGDYKGQYHTIIGDIFPNEIYTWGEFNYKNNTNFAISPNIVDSNNIDNLTLLTKSSENYYYINIFNTVVSTTLQIVSILGISNVLSNYTCNSIDSPISFNLILGYTYGMIYASLSNITWNNHNVLYVNCRMDSNTNTFGNTANSYAEIKNCYFDKSGIFDCTFDVGAAVDGLVENGGAILIQSNHISSCTNNSTLNNIVCEEGNIELQALSIEHGSFIKNINKTGNGVFKLQDLDLYQGSEISDLNIEITNNRTYGIRSGQWYKAKFKNITYTNAYFQSNIQDESFQLQDTEINGYTDHNFNKLNVYGNKGTFVVTHNFTITPLNVGDSILYNFIPNSARVVNIKTFGTTSGDAGAELAFGIDTDDPTILPSTILATVNAGQTYNSVSTPATANRSLEITAAVGNVTGGEVTVLIEFVL